MVSHMHLAQAQETRVTREYLSQIISKARETYRLPAVVVAMMNSQSVLLQEVQGERALDTQGEATLDDFFHLGSCSKSVLAVMAAKLIEQKKITWETQFFELFPELKDEADSAYYDITLEDLLRGEAGIQAFTNADAESLPVYDSSVGDKRLEFIRYLVKQPPASKRKNGKFQHLYSNAGYTMASAMLERVTNERYEYGVKKMLADDLGLSVHIGWPNEISVDQPWGHVITKNKVEALPPEHEYRLPDLLVPAGDLSMTARDFIQYTQLHLQGLTGVDNYITAEAYRKLHFGHDGYSLGIANGTLGGKRISGFDGTAGTFFCRSVFIPESDFAFTIMTNAGSGSGSMRGVDWLTMRIVKKAFNWWWKFWL